MTSQEKYSLRREELKKKYALRVRNAAQVVLVCRQGERLLKGSQMQNIAVLEADGARGVGVVIGTDGKIAAVGHNEEVSRVLSLAAAKARKLCIHSDWLINSFPPNDTIRGHHGHSLSISQWGFTWGV